MALVALQLTGVETITGRVIKAGTAIEQPLRNARVELIGGPATGSVARTDSNGKFVFSGLAPGEYRLMVTCDGFIRQQSAKTIMLGRGQALGNILFQLEPAPTAAGRVLDSYGEPIPNVQVEALRRSYDLRGNPGMTRVASALTDDRGEYRIFWLDPGEYFFYASPLPDNAGTSPLRVIAPTFFPGVTTPDDARPLPLGIGREVPVDFRLRRDAALWPINGQTMNEITGRPVAAAITLTPPAEDPNLSRYRAQSSATRPFSIENVPPGTYILSAKAGSGDSQLTAFQRIVLRPVLVTPRNGYSVSLMLSAPASVNGRLFVESGETIELRETGVELLSVDPDLPSPQKVLARPDGQFVLNGVVPGSYVLETSNLPQDFYLKAARFGAGDVLEKPLTLEPRQAAYPLQILLGADGGRLQVAAYGAGGELHAGAKIVLVPEAERERREQYRVATAGEDGTAMLRGIAPGRYRLFAWEELEPNAYLNADFMRVWEAFGASMTIASGENAPLSIRVIPKSQ
jgi:hypothetical protein